jgi:hypothetical protein
MSILARHNIDLNPKEAMFFGKNKSQNTCLSSRHCLSKLMGTIETKFTPISRSDLEIEIKLLRSKLEKIQGCNKDLYEEITLLWRDFKVGMIF